MRMGAIKVAIVGGGMAGLTAALRLAERGADVTVYEQKPYLGGQLSAHSHDGGLRYHEHCYHMFLTWYHNFWALARDIGLDRERDFERRESVLHRYRGHSRMPALSNFGAPASAWANLFSGVVPPPDMFLYGYSLIDLLTRRFGTDRLLDQVTVAGFMQSRPYASEHSALVHEHTLAKAFASPSYLSSARSYRSFVRYGLRHPDPMLWILKRDSERGLMEPLARKLAALGCRVRTRTTVQHITFSQGPGRRALSLVHEPSRNKAWEPECTVGLERGAGHRPPDGGAPVAAGEEAVDYVILAIPPAALGTLLAPDSALGPAPTLTKGASGPGEEDLGFPEFPKLRSEPLASLDLYFDRRLNGVPREHVVLVGSRYGLTFIDNGQSWAGQPYTTLNVIATDFKALANFDAHEAMRAMIAELREFFPFPAEALVDAHLQTNVGDELFVSEVGSEQWRPTATTASPNLFLAGDFCRTAIDVVTVEGAVVSGLLAAEALRARAVADRALAPGDQLREPIAVTIPEAYPDAALHALKLWLMPAAYAAKCWSMAREVLDAPPGHAPAELRAAAGRALFMPYTLGLEWWRAAWFGWADLWAARDA
jgi:hypothetical protein